MAVRRQTMQSRVRVRLMMAGNTLAAALRIARVGVDVSELQLAASSLCSACRCKSIRVKPLARQEMQLMVG